MSDLDKEWQERESMERATRAAEKAVSAALEVAAQRDALRADLADASRQLKEVGPGAIVAARKAFTRADNELILLRAELGELRGENQRLRERLSAEVERGAALISEYVSQAHDLTAENQRLRSERDEARGYAAGSES